MGSSKFSRSDLRSSDGTKAGARGRFVSSLVAAAMAVAPYHMALAAPAEPEEIMPDAPIPTEEPPVSDAPAPAEEPPAEPPPAEEPPAEEPPAGEDGGEPAGEDGGEPAGEDGGEPAGEDGGEPAGEDGGEPAGEDGGEPAGEDGGEEPPAEEPPEEEPPAEEPPAEEPPAEEPVPADDFVPEEDERPEEPRVAGRPAKGTGLMIAGGVTLGLGAAWTTTFALVTRNCSFDGPLQCRLQNQDAFLIPVGVSAMVLGTILLSVGAGWRVRYNRWERWTPGEKSALVPTFGRNHAGVAYTGRF